MKQRLIGFGLLAALVVVAGFGLNQLENGSQTSLQAATESPTSLGASNYASTKVRINSQTFKVELAVTADQQALGLGQRDILAKNAGMLFVFKPAAVESFWMKDMRFDLDMIWIADGKIVDISRHVPAPKTGTKAEDLPTYSPNTAVDYVLEVSSGAADDMKVGDRVEIVNSSQV